MSLIASWQSLVANFLHIYLNIIIFINVLLNQTVRLDPANDKTACLIKVHTYRVCMHISTHTAAACQPLCIAF